MLFKVLNVNGKEVGQSNSFKRACDVGLLIFGDSDFLVKEGNRKAEKVDHGLRLCINRYNDMNRKIIKSDAGFRLEE